MSGGSAPVTPAITRAGVREALLAFCVYAALTIVQGRHVIAGAADHVPHDAGDPVLNVSILAWNAAHVPLSEEWWNFPGFYPIPSTLTFSEHLLGLSVIATPVIWLTGNATVAYNILFLASFTLCAIAAYALVYHLTRNAVAAFLAGLIFGFAPFRVSHLAHLQVLSAYWMPVALLALHLYLETRRARWLVLFGAAWLLQSLANGYYFLYFSLFVALWIGWFLLAARQWKPLLAVAGTTAIAAIPMIPIVARYRRVYVDLGFGRDISEISRYSADVAALGSAAGDLSAWGWLDVFPRLEGQLFPGPTLILLIVVAAVFSRSNQVRDESSSRWRRVARRWLFAAATISLLVAATVWLVGPWRLDLPFVRISAGDVYKPFSLALAFAVGAAALGSRFRNALRESSHLWFYGLAAVTTWVLALGPQPTLFGRRILYQPPYRWLLGLPGFDSARAPARFWMITLLCLAVVAAILFARAASVRRRVWQTAIGTTAAIGLVIDGWTAIPAVPGPDRLPMLDTYVRDSRVLELPLNDGLSDAGAQYRAVAGGWKTFNGYSGFIPPHYQVLEEALDARADRIFTQLRGYGALTVVVHEPGDSPGGWAPFVQRQADAERLLATDRITVFRFPPATR